MSIAKDYLRESDKTLETEEKKFRTTSIAKSYIQDAGGGPTISINSQKKKTKEEDGLIENMESVDPPEVNNAYSFAFGLGLKDTYRGGKQILGIDKAQMKANQQKLNELMRGPNGGWVTAAYFAGAILDPAGWLIPFGKAKNIYSMAKTGVVSGAIAGATGYVDEESFIDSRGKQALLGAVGGGIVAPAMGGLKNLGVKITGKGNIIPLGRKLTKQQMMDRGASTVQISGVSKTGKSKGEAPVETTGPETLVIQKDADIADEGKSIFDAVKDLFNKKVNKITYPNVKAVHDIPKPTSRGPKFFLSRLINGYQNSYEKHIGKRLL
jgi:hypothetical protein